MAVLADVLGVLARRDLDEPRPRKALEWPTRGPYST